eukprot:3116006-Pleurochrysis_carterae.AAC.2
MNRLLFPGPDARSPLPSLRSSDASPSTLIHRAFRRQLYRGYLTLYLASLYSFPMMLGRDAPQLCGQARYN